LKRSEFHFELPAELIAQQPLARRSDSRLLQLSRAGGQCGDHVFRQLPGLLAPGDLLVFNDTRVIPARLRGRKETGGKVEVLIERMLDGQCCLAQVRASKPPPAGTRLILEDGTALRVERREQDFFLLYSADENLDSVLSRLGHVPLPPYIQREDAALDRERYQTVYARRPGAVAAPTAGLHFDHPLLQALQDRGVHSVSVTLHVGAATFQPVRVDRVEDHQMHAEYLEVTSEVCEAVAETRERGGRVIAVGTTSVRSLETAASGGTLQPYSGESRLFIYPGFEFHVTDGIITNFHLPESTLLMLISAFAGHNAIRAAYAHAVQSRYRFFSYGDAMLIL